MRYIILIYGDDSQAGQASEAELGKIMADYNAYTADLNTNGVLLAGEALQPTAMATTVRIRDGKRLTTDGPFAETKEQLGGYYVVKCDNLDQAIEWAFKCPGALNGSIEVRPIVDFPEA